MLSAPAKAGYNPRTMQLLNLLLRSLGSHIFAASARGAPLLNDPLNGVDGTQDLAPRQLSDSINNTSFLRRGFQSSSVVGDWVYLDGGDFSLLTDGVLNFYHSTSLSAISLANNWTNATVSIKSSSKPDGVPSLNNPSLWYYEEEDSIYTGFTGWNSSFNDPDGIQSPLPPLSLWSLRLDGNGSGDWNEVIEPSSSVWHSMRRPSTPLKAQSPETAFILGGTDELHAWVPFGGMVEFNMQSRTFVNRSAPCCDATNGIHRGAMHYVQSFGPDGILLAMGGQNGLGGAGNISTLIDFSVVSVFDPTERAWWNQTTTGTPPDPRIEFCIAGINSTNGTYEILVYAGWTTVSGSAAIVLDTAHILTLPAFHWIQVLYPPRSPRHAHSCNPVGGSQILVIGGLDTNNAATDEAKFSTPDPFRQGLAIFDMTALRFADQYTAKAPPYTQSDRVKQYYSQSPQTYLENLDPNVAALMKVAHFSNTSNTPVTPSLASKPSTDPSSTSPAPIHPPSKHHLGAILGGTLGGSAALSLFISTVFLIRHRRHLRARRNQKPTISNSTSGTAEVSPQNGMPELQTDPRPLEADGNDGVQEMDGNPRWNQLGSEPLHAELQVPPAELWAGSGRGRRIKKGQSENRLPYQ